MVNTNPHHVYFGGFQLKAYWDISEVDIKRENPEIETKGLKSAAELVRFQAASSYLAENNLLTASDGIYMERQLANAPKEYWDGQEVIASNVLCNMLNPILSAKSLPLI